MNWTRDQLLLALNLYYQTPFGKQHKTHPPIVALAEKIERTPSAVAMKLGNFTSLDPAEKERGIAGLSGASNADRAIWKEFQSNRNELAADSEALLEQQFGSEATKVEAEPLPPQGATEQVRSTRVRLQQRYFRRVILGSYQSRCCVTGLSVPTLLRASHIVPWAESESHRLDPSNGLCLSATFDAAFDRGLISLSDDLRLLLSPALGEFADDKELESSFFEREGDRIVEPVKNLPSQELLLKHRERWGFPN